MSNNGNMDVDSPGDQFDFGWPAFNLDDFALDPATVASFCDDASQPSAAAAGSNPGRGAGGCAGGDALGEFFASCVGNGRQGAAGGRRGDVGGGSGEGGLLRGRVPGVGVGGGGATGGGGGGLMEDDEISAMARTLLLEDTTLHAAAAAHAHAAAAGAYTRSPFTST